MKTKDKINPVFSDVMYISPQQVYLRLRIQEYRKKYNLSQIDMAKICTLHGEPHGVKFNSSEISKYENYKTIPTVKKFQILMNTLGLNGSSL